MQASETLKLILRLSAVTDFKCTRLINLLDGSTDRIERSANPSCPVCGNSRPRNRG